MACPYFLNISMIFFLFLFLLNSGPAICFTTDSPSSRYNPTFSLCKRLQSFVKMNELTNLKTLASLKHHVGPSKSSLPNFFNQSLLSLTLHTACFTLYPKQLVGVVPPSLGILTSINGTNLKFTPVIPLYKRS